MTGIWYRADERRIDDGSVEIAVVEWKVVKATPQGVWLTCPSSPYLKKRWASVSSRVFAPTRTEALDKLISRRVRQCRLLENKLRVATDALDEAAALRRTMP